MDSNSIDVRYKDVREDFAASVRQLLKVPGFAEVSQNLVSMANFLPLIEPLIHARQPRTICEIGAYRGISTRALAQLATDLGAVLHAVDPAVDPDYRHPESGPVEFHGELSETFLSANPPMDVYFIDGDHNFEVVSKELDLIADKSVDRPSPLLFMHDVGWPWAYRDLYYSVDRIRNPKPLSSTGSVELTVPDSSRLSVSLPITQDIAAEEGGDQNGVRGAIEHFLSARQSWRMLTLPSLFGLGIMWDEATVTQPVRDELLRLDEILQLINPFLATLELNRIMLLAKVDEIGAEWENNQEWIKRQSEELATLRDKIERAKTVSGLIGLMRERIRK